MTDANPYQSPESRQTQPTSPIAFGLNPYKTVARVVALMLYFLAGVTMFIGIFFVLGAATADLSTLPLKGFTNFSAATFMACMFLFISCMELALGVQIKRLFGQRRPVDKLAANSVVGCLSLSSLGCGGWMLLSTIATLIAGKFLYNNEPATLGTMLVGLSGPAIVVLVMLSIAWFIRANFGQLTPLDRNRIYESYRRIVQNLRPRISEPDTFAYLQELTLHVFSKLDRSLKGKLLVLLSESRLLTGNTRLNLKGTDFRGANLNAASLPEAVLQGIDMTGASLQGASLFKVDLRESILRGVDLTRANLQGADLRRADLTDAVLDDSILTDAVLVQSQVTMQQLKCARLLHTTMPDGNVTPPMAADTPPVS